MICKHHYRLIYSCLKISTGLSLTALKDGIKEDIRLIKNEKKHIKNIWPKFIFLWLANSNAQTLNHTVIKTTEIIVSIGTISFGPNSNNAIG